MNGNGINNSSEVTSTLEDQSFEKKDIINNGTAASQVDLESEKARFKSSYGEIIDSTSLIVIDSLSHHFRGPPSSLEEKSQRKYALEELESIGERIKTFNKDKMSSSSSCFLAKKEKSLQEERQGQESRLQNENRVPITLLFTNQMATQLFHLDGTANNVGGLKNSNSKNGNNQSSIAKLLPQVQASPFSKDGTTSFKWKSEEGEKVPLTLGVADSLEDSMGQSGSVFGKEVWRLMAFRVESGHR